jgi:hypothetical protein
MLGGDAERDLGPSIAREIGFAGNVFDEFQELASGESFSCFWEPGESCTL